MPPDVLRACHAPHGRRARRPACRSSHTAGTWHWPALAAPQVGAMAPCRRLCILPAMQGEPATRGRSMDARLAALRVLPAQAACRPPNPQDAGNHVMSWQAGSLIRHYVVDGYTLCGIDGILSKNDNEKIPKCNQCLPRVNSGLATQDGWFRLRLSRGPRIKPSFTLHYRQNGKILCGRRGRPVWPAARGRRCDRCLKLGAPP